MLCSRLRDELTFDQKNQEKHLSIYCSEFLFSCQLKLKKKKKKKSDKLTLFLTCVTAQTGSQFFCYHVWRLLGPEIQFDYKEKTVGAFQRRNSSFPAWSLLWRVLLLDELVVIIFCPIIFRVMQFLFLYVCISILLLSWQCLLWVMTLLKGKDLLTTWISNWSSIYSPF